MQSSQKLGDPIFGKPKNFFGSASYSLVAALSRFSSSLRLACARRSGSLSRGILRCITPRILSHPHRSRFIHAAEPRRSPNRLVLLSLIGMMDWPTLSTICVLASPHRVGLPQAICSARRWPLHSNLNRDKPWIPAASTAFARVFLDGSPNRRSRKSARYGKGSGTEASPRSTSIS